MKHIVTGIVLLCCAFGAHASDEKYADKVKTLDTTIETLYAVISGDKGVARDWDLFRYLFKPGARLMPSGKRPDGSVSLQVLSPDQYIERSGAFLVDNGFHEVEIGRKQDEYGTIAQVFSAYESRRSLSDAEPFARGINSIQLLKDTNRWWIISVFWMGETDEFPLPAAYID